MSEKYRGFPLGVYSQYHSTESPCHSSQASDSHAARLVVIKNVLPIDLTSVDTSCVGGLHDNRDREDLIDALSYGTPASGAPVNHEHW
jgi:hypothetical protein